MQSLLSVKKVKKLRRQVRHFVAETLGEVKAKMLRHSLTRHEGFINRTLNKAIVKLNHSQYPKDSLDFLENEKTHDDS